MIFLPLQLCTQIIEKNANPEWNQMLNLQAKVRGPVEGKRSSSHTKLFNMNNKYGVWILVQSLIFYSSPPCVSVLNWQSLIGKSDLNLMVLFGTYFRLCHSTSVLW